MKKLRIIGAILLLTVMFTVTVSAGENTTYCYTTSIKGEWIRTQDAYMPSGVMKIGETLNVPEDLFVKGSKLYIADSGNSRILIFDMKTKSRESFGGENLKQPTGVYVSETAIYVADFGASSVFVFDMAYQLIMTIERPVSPIFSESSTYKPTKVLADLGGNIYIVSDGSYEGILQFTAAGEFVGYFGVNQASVTPLEAIQDLLFSEEQKAALFRRIPHTVQNIAEGHDDMIYSVTRETVGNALKKHNMAGVNTFSKQGLMADETNFTDVCVLNTGFVYALTDTGLIYEYDLDGNLVFSFGGRAVSSERNGLFTVAAAIDVDEDGILYVLDKERGLVQSFYPTAFAEKTHQSIISLKQGDYEKSKVLWNELLKLNGMSRLAHNGYGRTLFREQRFDEAAEHFKLARNTAEYSEAFWEIRNIWLNEHLPAILVAMITLSAALILLRALQKRKGIFNPVKRRLSVITQKKAVSDLMFIKNVFRHPIDSFYYIRKNEKGSLFSASMIYFAGFIVFLLSRLFKGFIFSSVLREDASVLQTAVLFFVPVLLFAVGSYFVSSINNGEGTVKQVYIATAYSLSPYLLFMPVMVILSYALTLNEAFVISFGSAAVYAYTALTIIFGVKEIHNYSVKETLKNILISLFFVLIAIIAFAILYLLWGQIAEFVKTIFGEVGYRVG